uniref:Uncharacterized protein n=1 Tax=Arundo donax TaxID=35708 RepID=A0A0A9DQX0_ARUDO
MTTWPLHQSSSMRSSSSPSGLELSAMLLQSGTNWFITQITATIDDDYSRQFRRHTSCRLQDLVSSYSFLLGLRSCQSCFRGSTATHL